MSNQIVHIFMNALSQVKVFRSYRCMMEMETWEENYKKAVCRYVYRERGDIRIDQIRPKKGTVVIRSSGTIYAKGSGILSMFTVRLGKDSPLLKGITGQSVLESDWITIYQKLLSHPKEPLSSQIRKVSLNHHLGYDIELKVKEKEMDRFHFLVRDDGPLLFIEKLKSNTTLSRISWKDIELNPLISDDAFEM